MSGDELPLTVSVPGSAAGDFDTAYATVKEGGGRTQVRLTVTCTAATPLDGGVRVEASLGRTADPHWLVPGLFYGENRLASCTRLYPRFVPNDGDESRFESREWSFRADRCATPAVFAWDDARGLALVTSETSPLGQAGVGLALLDGKPLLRLHFPYREEPVAYDGSDVARPADLPAYRWTPGETVELHFDVYSLSADRHDYSRVLRDVHARGARAADAAWVPIADAAELTAWGLWRWHYKPEPPVLLETAAFDREALGDRGDRKAMHVSWVSGIPYAHALLRHGRRVGDERYVDAAVAVIDGIAANLAPGGTFWGQWSEAPGWPGGDSGGGGVWTVGWTPDPRRLHSRTLGDAALFLTRAIAAERTAGVEHPSWVPALRSNLDVACTQQRTDGALGSAYDAHTGAVLSWEGTAGLAWVPALAEAGDMLGEPRYLDAARRAGAYYRGMLDDEWLCGAPEDVDLAPTSEDGYLAVVAYVVLHELDPGGDWLDAARRAADWTLTFRYTYDVAFPPHTMLGTYGFRSRGADQASPANQHLHSFGLICLPEMVRLARYTGDEYYLASTRENLDCFRQFVAREDGDFDAYRGMVSERFYQTACFQAKGMLLTLSHAWCVGVLLYACEAALEIPELRDGAG
jgi:hypothetical protein